MNFNNSESIKVNEMERDIDFKDLLSYVWRLKFIVLAITSVFACASIIYCVCLSDVYKSEALLAPVNDDVGQKVSGQLGGLAALAGVNLGADGVDKTNLAIEIIKSRDFISRFIDKYALLVPVMAGTNWDRRDNTLILDEDIYDSKLSKWVRDVDEPFQAKPSLQEAYNTFIKFLNVSQDKTTGLVTVSVEYFSPKMAHDWLNLLIIEINYEMRKKDIADAQESIAYLNAQIEKTNISDIRRVLYSLIEEQTKTLMLANVRKEYVLETIDRGIIPEKKSGPKRLLIVAMVSFLGFMLTVFYIVLRYIFKF